MKRVNGRGLEFVRDRGFRASYALVPRRRSSTHNLRSLLHPFHAWWICFSPIGKGQRGLIVAPPKTRQDTSAQDIANAIAENHPETYIMILLIDERRGGHRHAAQCQCRGNRLYLRRATDHHVKIAGIVLEKAKRLVESGHDVVVFLDSITRLARAYNTVAPASGKILSGGVDANALQKPKRFFGAARATSKAAARSNHCHGAHRNKLQDGRG